jgi:hypothetical protein
MPLEIVQEMPPEPEVRRIEFLGEEFVIADKIGLMPLLRFAHAAKSGLDSSDMEGLAAMYDLLRQCIADEPVCLFRGRRITREEYGDLPPEATAQTVMYGGWNEFEAHATVQRAGDNDLMNVMQDVMRILTERPTSRPSDSSAGPQRTAPISAEDSSSLEVVRRLKSQGRPDLAMAVLRQQTG